MSAAVGSSKLVKKRFFFPNHQFRPLFHLKLPLLALMLPEYFDKLPWKNYNDGLCTGCDVYQNLQ